jgi:aldehyde dehydrogenase (NAD+)
MENATKFYINGKWVKPKSSKSLDVINPATEEVITSIVLGNQEDVEQAIAAARAAFDEFASTTKDYRIDLLEKIIEEYKRRLPDIAAITSQEMGAPMDLASNAQAPAGLGHFMCTLEALRNFEFEEQIDTTTIAYEAVGVCGLITPWNWPLNQISAKVAPAIATGCTMVLKPSELAPLNAIIIAEIMDAAGVPKGVFNLVHGDGSTVGSTLSSHPDIDMVSFTGSTRAGIEVAKNAAPTVKRVTQELGGKSANIMLDDANLEETISRDAGIVCVNTGQSCNAGTRFLVPTNRMNEAAEIAKKAMENVKVGAPEDEGVAVGPVVSQAQYEKIQTLIQSAIDEGATLVTGGLGHPTGLEKGFYVKPTVFADVTNEMTIAREEIFGPVITLIGYKDEEDAIRIANDTVYGLSGYVSSADTERARVVARRIRTGMVHINGAQIDFRAPFGGYKQSGNGREFSDHGLRDFLEAKSIFGDL